MLFRSASEYITAIERQRQVEQQAGDSGRDALEQAQFELSLIGQSALEQERLNAVRGIDLELRRQIAAVGVEDGDFMTASQNAEIERLTVLANARKAAVSGLVDNKAAAELQTVAHHLERLHDLVSDLRNDANMLGESFVSVFGEKIGGAFDKLTQSVVGFGERSAQSADEFQKNFSKAFDSLDYSGMFAAIGKFQADSAKSNAKMFGDMAQAAKGFFKEHSTGYRVMEATERAFRVVEMALALQSYMTKLGQMLGLTAVKATTTTTNIGLEAAETGASVGMSGTRTIASTIAGVAKAFEQMGVYGFIGAAAIIAFMASLGASAGGGGGSAPPDIAAERQRKQGTGTVLGDDTAKSESIAHSLEILTNNSSDDLLYQSALLTVMRSVESSMKGLALAAARMGLTGQGIHLPADGGGNAFSLADIGVIIGRMIGPADSERTQFGPQSLANLIANPQGSRYTDITRSHTGTFQGSTYSATNSEFAPLEQAFMDQVRKAAINLRDALATAVNILMGGTIPIEKIKEMLEGLNIDIHQISFKDLKGDEIQAAIQAVFSAIGDDLATGIMAMLSDPAQLGALEDFQRVGEGAFETIIRVASGVERATAVLRNWGVSIIDWRDIVNKQGDVTTELIRQSVVARETSNGVVSGFGQIINAFDGTADELISLYEKLTKLRESFILVGMGANMVTQANITAAGGLERLQNGLDVYFQNFFTDQERATMLMDQARQKFKELGLEMPTTREGLRAMIEHFKALGDDAMVARLIALVPLWDDAGTAAEDAAKKAKESWESTQDLLGDLFGEGDPARNARHAATATGDFNTMFGTNLTFSQIPAYVRDVLMDPTTWAGLTTAQRDLIDAVLHLAIDVRGNTAAIISGPSQSGRSQQEIDFENYYRTAGARRGLGSYLDGLALNAQATTLSPSQRLLEAQRQYQDALGHQDTPDGIQHIQQTAEAYRTVARELYGSSSEYVTIFNNIFHDLAGIAEVPDINERIASASEKAANRLDNVYAVLMRIADGQDTLEDATREVGGYVRDLRNPSAVAPR
jgi:hypothetical protein